MKDLPLIIGHRGASADAPENTLAAFAEAWKQQADGIEGDYRLTQEGSIVCIHDETTERTGDQSLDVETTPWETLHKVDVGGWKGEQWKGEGIPKFEEVLAQQPEDKTLVIEIKSGPELVEPLAALLETRKGLLEHVLIISFHEPVIAACKLRLPIVRALPIYYLEWNADLNQLLPSNQELVQKVKALGADGLSLYCHPKMDSEYVAPFHAEDFLLNTWTVDDLKTAKQFNALGFHSISTNRPAFIRDGLISLP